MPKGPFDFDDDFENIPVVKATAQVAKKTGDAAAKQASNTTKAIVNQLYAPSDQSTADDDQQADVAPGAQAQTHNKPTASTAIPPNAKASMSATHHTTSQHAQDPSDQAKLEETRKKLQQQHMQEYFNPTIGDLETQMKRDDARKKQEEDMQEQQEEQEKKQEMEALEEQKKKELPMAVKMGQNRTESNRGVSG